MDPDSFNVLLPYPDFFHSLIPDPFYGLPGPGSGHFYYLETRIQIPLMVCFHIRILSWLDPGSLLGLVRP